MPINIHRMIANVAFGGAVAAGYAAFRFLYAKTDEEKEEVAGLMALAEGHQDLDLLEVLMGRSSPGR